MAEGFDDNKTEAPTPRRRERAREEGQVVFSPDLNSGVALMLLACAAVWLFPRIAEQLGQMLAQRVNLLDGREWGAAPTVIAGRWLGENLWLVAGGFALCFLSLNMLLAQVQVGFLITFKPLEPNWERLNVVSGLQRLWSWDGGMRGLTSLLKMSSLLAVTAALLWKWNADLQLHTHGELRESVALGWEFLRQLMLCMAGMTLLWGILDYGFKWFRLEQKLRMSREDIKDEHKDEEGDPHMKARIRKLQRESGQRRTLKDVPKASVILTNPTHYAVALRYEPGMKAPRVVAKGTGSFARQITRIAREHSIPILERKPLARALYALADVGKDIPLEFYRAVAEILALVYRMKNSA